VQHVGLQRGGRAARGRVTPQFLSQRGDGDDPPGVEHEQGQDLTLLGRARRHRPVAEVDRERAEYLNAYPVGIDLHFASS
jgi:hypothetical protein